MTDSTLAKIISRTEAKAAGLNRYFTGIPCGRGHVCERFTTTYNCVECARITRNHYEAKPEVAARRHQRRAKRMAASPEKFREQARNRYAAKPELYRQMAKDWRTANAEKVKRSYHAYYWADIEKTRETKRNWRLANPEKARAIKHNRRAREKAAEGFHTGEDVQRIYAAQKGKCACCREKVGKTYEVDHIVPLSKGGSNWPANLQILCPTCNAKKWALDPVEFMQSLGRLL